MKEEVKRNEIDGDILSKLIEGRCNTCGLFGV